MTVRLLGAILAGGQSRRFGSDKALALLDGRPLIAHVIERLARQVDELVLVGRPYAAWHVVADYPSMGLGPLGGLCGALRFAQEAGFDGILSSGCDLPQLPPDLRMRLVGVRPAVIAGQPLVGYWPSQLADRLIAHLSASQDNLSMRRWIEISGAETRAGVPMPNINTPADLAVLERLMRPADPRSSP